jgi:hypothetical protein
MADFQAKAPVEPNKGGEYLHHRERLPDAPRSSVGTLISQNSGWIAGVIFALCVSALIFQLRDGWESHRDWVPPAAMVPCILGALAIGFLGQRGRVNAIAIPVGLLSLAVMSAMLHLWLEEEFPKQEGLILAFTIIGSVSLGLGTLLVLVALLVVEGRDPVKPAGPAA